MFITFYTFCRFFTFVCSGLPEFPCDKFSVPFALAYTLVRCNLPRVPYLYISRGQHFDDELREQPQGLLARLSFAFVLLASGTSQPGTLLKSASDFGRIFPDMAERRQKMFGKRNMSVDSYFDLNTSELDRTDHESTDSLRKKIISNLSFGVNGLTPSSKQYMESMEKSAKIAALKPKDWKKVSAKHREKFVQLSEIWENAESNPELITIINDNGVCFKEEFSIGRGSNQGIF